jgi:hypothetical protein
VITRAETAVSIVPILNMVRPGKSGRETRTVYDGEDAAIVHAAITFTASSVTQRRRRPLDRNTPPLARGERWQGRNLTRVALSLSAQPRSPLFTLFMPGDAPRVPPHPLRYGGVSSGSPQLASRAIEERPTQPAPSAEVRAVGSGVDYDCDGDSR